MTNGRPTRKPHRLNGYDYSAQGAYFVTFCTKDRRPILSRILAGMSSACPPEIQLTPLGLLVERAILQIPERYAGVVIEQYVIMPNHVHILLSITQEDGPKLGRIMQQMKGHVTKQCGHAIWQDKYYDHVIRDENDFLVKYKYICDNPSRWAEDEYYSAP